MKPEPQEYLQPGYNASKLTIAELTSILSAHNVSIPSSKQQKQVYLDLFYSKLTPLGPQILQDMENIVPLNDFERVNKENDNDNKRNLEADKRASKRIKQLDSPSMLPIRKGRKQKSPSKSPKVAPLSLAEQDVECPKQDRFLINPTLPGVRQTVSSPATPVKSVKQRAQAYEHVIQKELEAAGKSAQVAPSAEPVDQHTQSNKISLAEDIEPSASAEVLSWVAAFVFALLPALFYVAFLEKKVVSDYFWQAYGFVGQVAEPYWQYMSELPAYQSAYDSAVIFLHNLSAQLKDFQQTQAWDYILEMRDSFVALSDRIQPLVDHLKQTQVSEYLQELAESFVAIFSRFPDLFVAAKSSLNGSFETASNEAAAFYSQYLKLYIETAVRNTVSWTVYYLNLLETQYIDSTVRYVSDMYPQFEAQIAGLVNGVDWDALTSLGSTNLGFFEAGLVVAWTAAMALVYVLLPAPVKADVN